MKLILLAMQLTFLIFQYVYMFKMFRDIDKKDYKKEYIDFTISIFNGICVLLVCTIRICIGI